MLPRGSATLKPSGYDAIFIGCDLHAPASRRSNEPTS
jgi:hypothetical protein